MAGLIEKMSRNPARILGKDNRLIPGNPADLTLIDPQRSFTLRAQDFRSKSRNTPFDGWTVKGRAVMTIVGGRIVYE
jgi:dihydroorotase